MAKKFYKEENENAIIYSDSHPPTSQDGNDFFEITDQTELNSLYLKQNKKLKEDGLYYVATFKVENFGIKKRDGILTNANVDYLYTKLSQLLIRLEDGNWEAALFYLNNHLNTITQTDIDNGYTQEIHDNIVQDIQLYLDNL